MLIDLHVTWICDINYIENIALQNIPTVILLWIITWQYLIDAFDVSRYFLALEPFQKWIAGTFWTHFSPWKSENSWKTDIAPVTPAFTILNLLQEIKKPKQNISSTNHLKETNTDIMVQNMISQFCQQYHVDFL